MPAGVAFIFLLVGLFHLFLPQASWFLSIGWKLRDAEPSDTYLALSRVGGGIVSVIAAFALVIAFVQAGQQSAHQMDAWNTFTHEMTVANIQSIAGDPGNTPVATPAQIREFVSDLKASSNVQSMQQSSNARGGTFSSNGSFLITCRDGYHAELINVDNMGTFGMASSSAWLLPEYEFTNAILATWVSQLTLGITG